MKKSQNGSLKTELKSILKIDDEQTINILMDGYNVATSTHKAFNGIYDGQYKEILKALKTLSVRFKMVTKGTGTQNTVRIVRALDCLPPILLRIMDTINPEIYKLKDHPAVTAENAAHSFKNADAEVKYFDHIKSEREKYSVFKETAIGLDDLPNDRKTVLAEQLDNIVLITIEDLKKPGHGGAKKQAKKFERSIILLSHYFKEALPEYELCATDLTKFHDYVCLWLKTFTEWDGELASRHIKNALALKDEPF